MEAERETQDDGHEKKTLRLSKQSAEGTGDPLACLQNYLTTPHHSPVPTLSIIFPAQDLFTKSSTNNEALRRLCQEDGKLR